MLDMNTDLYAENTDTAAANKTTLITLPSPGANKGQKWSIGGLAWSYDGPTQDTAPGGKFLVDTSAGIDIYATSTDTAAIGLATKVLSIDISEAGPGFIIPAEPFKFGSNLAVQIVMGDGGGVQKLTVLGAKLV